MSDHLLCLNAEHQDHVHNRSLDTQLSYMHLRLAMSPPMCSTHPKAFLAFPSRIPWALPPPSKPAPNPHRWTSEKSPHLVQVSIPCPLQWTPWCLFSSTLWLTLPALTAALQRVKCGPWWDHSLLTFWCFRPGWLAALPPPHTLSPGPSIQPLHGIVQRPVPNAWHKACHVTCAQQVLVK